MTQQHIHAAAFLQMMRAGAKSLNKHVERVNALNVFPVPDGDTGTNMNLTLTSGVKEMEKYAHAETVGKLAEALSKGLLMGARGNSGVILSQLFRGFAKAVSDKEIINARQLADAFQRGVETAYKAVIKPVEGTILTVSREAAEAGMKRSWQTNDPIAILETVLQEAKATLARTPDMLPVLKETGVVDAGGQGLVFIYEGMLAVLKGEVVEELASPELPDLESISSLAHEQNAQAQIDPASIEHGYCTEFIVMRGIDRRELAPFQEAQFRQEMETYGDSLLVVADEDLVKVHIHAEHPGDALNHAMKYGDLTRIKIDNMREQHSSVTEGTAKPSVATKTVEMKKYGLVAVTAGKGIADIFTSLGVDVVIEGGQTMNPSTEDIAKAIEQISAEHIFILPNNKNIILTAEQVGEVIETPVTVLPTKTVPQGLSALLAFNPEISSAENKENMMDAYSHIQSGELTYAIRDTQMNDMTIKEGDFLGIKEGKIEASGSDMNETIYNLLHKMVDAETDVLTIIYGQDVSDEQLETLTSYVEETYPDIECEVYDGGQPLYFYLFSVE
ncbi:DAK2 domain-containing protein [Polycladospora coralii]|uniref:DAK2 domain-containing protein n=1 Tax=Polycladospora coralii TaxID=2771432 RepID=UPI003D2FE3C9